MNLSRKLNLSSCPLRYTIVFFIIFIYLTFFVNESQLHYDAKDYWLSSMSFFENGSIRKFSIFNFESKLRGYLWPLLLAPFSIISFYTGFTPVFMSKMIGSIIASSLIAHVIPVFFENIFDFKINWTWYKIILFTFLVLIFWGKYFIYPLTDFPALLAFVLALVMLKITNKRSWFLSGVFLASAVNLRPAYTIGLVFVLLAAILYIKSYNINILVKMFSCFGLGLIVVLLPQLLINIHNFNKSTPFVLSQRDDSENLYLWHLSRGMKVQKFETSVSNSAIPCIIFRDDAGEILLNDVNSGSSFTSYNTYIKAVLDNPLAFANIYIKHIFNMFDIKYSTPYIYTSIYELSFFYSLINYLCIITSIMFFLFMRHRMSKAGYVSLLSILVVMLISVPIVVECRFSAPIHILMLSFVSLGLFEEYEGKTIWIHVIKAKYAIASTFLLLPLFCYISYIVCIGAEFHPIDFFIR